MNPLRPFSQKIRQEGILTNVVFVVEDVKFAAHKAILAACSPVFCAMFSTNMEESNSNTIILTDAKPDVFSDFLDYIYTMDATYLMQHTEKMLYLADKYDLEFLASACDEIIEKRLTEQNAVDSLFVADLYRRSELKVKTGLFIKKHQHAISASNSWKKLEDNLELYVEMLQTYLHKDPPKAQLLYPNEVTWTLETKDDYHKSTASIFENGSVYRFKLSLDIYNSVPQITIRWDKSEFFDRILPVTIKLWCRSDGAIRWKLTFYWECNSRIDYKTFSLIESDYNFCFPCDLTLSMEKTLPSSSPMKFFRGVSADAKLTIGNSDILVHRSLLAEKSKFFADLFGKERTLEKYPIEGVSVKTLDTIVGLLYFPNQVLKNENVDFDLLRGAIKFKLEDLVNSCVDVLGGRITVANVVEAYAAAEKHSLDQLKAHVNRFIAENANDIVETGNLEDFKNHPELLKEVFLKVVSNHQ